MTITTIGLDLAKSVSQAHSIDESGTTVLVEKLHHKANGAFLLEATTLLDRDGGLRNRPLLGLHACSVGPRSPPDTAIVRQGLRKAGEERCAGCRSDLRSRAAAHHAVRAGQDDRAAGHSYDPSRLIAYRTATNYSRQPLRAHLAELGHVANPGIGNLAKLAEQVMADRDAMPSYARTALEILIRQIMAVSAEIAELDQQPATWHTESEASRRLPTIPGLVAATAIVATVTDAEQFSSGRQFAAWLGLTPQQHSTEGKTRLGGISKQGDRYLRRLLVVGATAVMRHVKDKPTPMAEWIRKLSEKKPFRLVSVALANKLSRIALVVLTRKGPITLTPI